MTAYAPIDGTTRRHLRLLIDARVRELHPPPEGVVELPHGTVHGTEAAYSNHRCRCDDCRTASREARKRRRQRAAA